MSVVTLEGPGGGQAIGWKMTSHPQTGNMLGGLECMLLQEFLRFLIPSYRNSGNIMSSNSLVSITVCQKCTNHDLRLIRKHPECQL